MQAPPAVRAARRVRRVLICLLLVVAILTTAALVAHRATTPRDKLDTVKPGELSVAMSARGTWPLDGATVSLDEQSLTIQSAGRTVWSSSPGESFLTAARGDVRWKENQGYFWPRVRLTDEFDDQSVDSVRADSASVIISGRLSDRDDTTAAYTLTITPRQGGGVITDVQADGVDVIELISGRSEDAGVHGFGAQFAEFDLDGRLIPIVTREQGVGRGRQPLTYLADLTNHGAGGTDAMTYAAWSTFVTDDLRGLSLDPDLPESQAFAVADTRDPDRIGLQVWAPRLRAELTAAATPAALVASQQAGNRPRLAEWTQEGAIVGIQGGTDVVRARVDALAAAGTKVSAVWLQDWTGQRTTSFGDRLWWTWQLDHERYPGWADLVADLRAQGIRTTTYVNPFLTDATDKSVQPERNLWAEARERGFLVRQAGGEPYLLDQGGFSASLVDLTNREAQRWFAEVIATHVLADGVDGFMADFGEGLPFDAVLADGDAALLHNALPRLWARTVAEACRIADKPDCVTWFRSGSLGMATDAALFWTGDQLVDFGDADGLGSALRGTLSGGVSGWPLVHSDVGGYTSIDAVVHDYVRPEDLLQRWAEFAAFGVLLRTHEGNRPADNAQVYDTPESRAAFGRMSRLFAALAPYRRTVLDEAGRTGVPAIRHGWLVHPGTAAAKVDTQFFLGDAILMAPVLESGSETVVVTFPPGPWVHLITGETFEGDRAVEVAAPLGTPAAFVSADDPRAADLQRAVHQVYSR